MTAIYRTDPLLGPIESRGGYSLGFAIGRSNHRDPDWGTEAEIARSAGSGAQQTTCRGPSCGARAGRTRGISAPIGGSGCPQGRAVWRNRGQHFQLRLCLASLSQFFCQRKQDFSFLFSMPTDDFGL
jgi:hypothetical protein